MQPVIRGIQAVGSVSITYRYNTPDGILPRPEGWSGVDIDTSNGIQLAGFRLDSEFLRAAQQIASSAMIPILGGGGLALTNNNRTGTLTINCSRVSAPETGQNMEMMGANTDQGAYGLGIREGEAYDLVIVSQYQQAATGGDSFGATIDVAFMFNGRRTTIQFFGVTVASVSPVALAGNDAANYAVELNYLDWLCQFSMEG